MTIPTSDTPHKICIVLGTRPELIKLAPVIRMCAQRELDYFVIHTGQHYSYEMDKIFFEELELPVPQFNLAVGSGAHGVQTGRMLIEIERILEQEKPSMVLVQGDTNSVLAGALAASKLHIPVGHVEAGLRSWDRRMPEELNRIMTDHISDLLFVPTEASKGNLIGEGIASERIHLTGNTIVDSVLQHIDLAAEKSIILKTLHLTPKEFVLLTVHRAENTDDSQTLAHIVEGIDRITKKHALPIVWPMHPRTKARMEKFGLMHTIPAAVTVIEPVGFLDFLQLENGARVTVTDSGGVQEEACILGTPCVTLRDSTERPETVEVGANLVVGTNPDAIEDGFDQMMVRELGWQNPFGTGQSAAAIVDLSLNARHAMLKAPSEVLLQIQVPE